MKEDFVELDFNYSIYIQFFIGLVAVVNPFGVLPIFVGMTTNQYEAQRNKTNLVMCISVAVILLTSLYLGQIILNILLHNKVQLMLKRQQMLQWHSVCHKIL